MHNYDPVVLADNYDAQGNRTVRILDAPEFVVFHLGALAGCTDASIQVDEDLISLNAGEVVYRVSQEKTDSRLPRGSVVARKEIDNRQGSE